MNERLDAMRRHDNRQWSAHVTCAPDDARIVLVVLGHLADNIERSTWERARRVGISSGVVPSAQAWSPC